MPYGRAAHVSVLHALDIEEFNAGVAMSRISQEYRLDDDK